MQKYSEERNSQFTKSNKALKGESEIYQSIYEGLVEIIGKLYFPPLNFEKDFLNQIKVNFNYSNILQRKQKIFVEKLLEEKRNIQT